MISHVILSMGELQGGLSTAALSEMEEKKVLYCGFVVIVSLFRPFSLYGFNTSLDSPAGAGKTIIWYVIFRLIQWYDVHVCHQLCHYQ